MGISFPLTRRTESGTHSSSAMAPTRVARVAKDSPRSSPRSPFGRGLPRNCRWSCYLPIGDLGERRSPDGELSTRRRSGLFAGASAHFAVTASIHIAGVGSIAQRPASLEGIQPTEICYDEGMHGFGELAVTKSRTLKGRSGLGTRTFSVAVPAFAFRPVQRSQMSALDKSRGPFTSVPRVRYHSIRDSVRQAGAAGAPSGSFL